MKRVGLAMAAVGLLMAGSSAAGAQDSEAVALAPMHQFADAMNAGDMKTASEAYTPSASIIDEFAPHHWNSFSDWARDADSFFKAEDTTGLKITLSTPTNKEIEAAYAYAVVPTTLNYLVKGKPVEEKGLFTFSMAKTAAGWRIAGWAWSTQ